MLAEQVTAYLSALDVESTYWPGDDEVRRFLATEPVYRRFRRPRLRMFLEAAEDHLRGYTSKPLTLGRVPRRGFHIEHVLPRRWQQHWPVADLAAELERQEHVHRLGNLTLLTGSLNASISNGPWSGPSGKRQKLKDHDVFLMNGRIRNVDDWNEQTIDARTGQMIEALIATWPVPAGHTGQVTQPKQDSGASEIYVAHLVAQGLLPVGTELRPRTGGPQRAVALADGRLEMDGKVYDSPSGAGQAVRGGATKWLAVLVPPGRQTIRQAARRGTCRRGVTSEAARSHCVVFTECHGSPDAVVSRG